MPRNVYAFLFAIIMWALQNRFPLACPAACACRWKSGKEMVECKNRGLIAIPDGIDSSTQVIDLSGNNLHSLAGEVFLKADLLNLQRIYLSNCQLTMIHSSAFTRLTNLVELDLTGNLLPRIPSDTFKDFRDLRRLSLSGNPLRRLADNEFVNLTSLTGLEMSQCHIEWIAQDAFNGLGNLTQLKLDGNKLHVILGATLLPLQALNGIELHNNPWKCDCHLRDLHKWLLKKKIHYSSPLNCDQPATLKGRTLDSLLEGDLACEPIGPFSQMRVEAFEGEDASLVCKVSGNPEPKIHWVWQGRKINNFTFVYPRTQFFYVTESGSLNKTSVLKIVSLSHKNSGQYVCLAENPAGKFLSTITLRVVEKPEEPLEPHLGHIIGIFLSVMTLTMVLVVFCVIILRPRSSKGKYVKYFSLYKIHKSFDSPRDKCNSNAEMRSSRNASSLKSSNKRSCSPDAMTFLLNDFGFSRSTYVNRLDNNPDVIHVRSDPAKQGTCNKGINNSRSENKRNDMKADHQILLDKIDNPIRDNKEGEQTEEEKHVCVVESNKSSNYNLNAESDKLKWKESFSSINDLEEEIEMKVHFDHVSTESKWKESSFSLSKFTTSTSNELLPGKNSSELVNSSEWLADESAEFKGYESPKYTNHDPHWTGQDLADDNNYNICMYYNPSSSSADVECNSESGEIKKSDSDTLNVNNPLDSDFLQSSLTVEDDPCFSGLFYGSRETEL